MMTLSASDRLVALQRERILKARAKLVEAAEAEAVGKAIKGEALFDLLDRAGLEAQDYDQLVEHAKIAATLADSEANVETATERLVAARSAQTAAEVQVRKAQAKSAEAVDERRAAEAGHVEARKAVEQAQASARRLDQWRDPEAFAERKARAMEITSLVARIEDAEREVPAFEKKARDARTFYESNSHEQSRRKRDDEPLNPTEVGILKLEQVAIEKRAALEGMKARLEELQAEDNRSNR